MKQRMDQILIRSTASVAVAGACANQAKLDEEARSLQHQIALVTAEAERETRRCWPAAPMICAADLCLEIAAGSVTLPRAAYSSFRDWLVCEQLQSSCAVINATNEVRAVALVKMHLACAKARRP